MHSLIYVWLKKKNIVYPSFQASRPTAATVRRWMSFIAGFSFLSCLDGFEFGPRFQFIGLKPEVSDRTS